MPNKVIATVVGARPQFIKAAPVSRALKDSFQEILIHTGQHYDYGMSDVFFEEMEMQKPNFHLGIGGGNHSEQTGKMLIELEKVLNTIKPNILLVYGDTNSTLAGALSAAKTNIPVAHIEAGLRSYNRTMPEEINRVLTDHISTFLFCPTDVAIKNLAKEGITNGVHQAGDVMFDALLHNLTLARKKSDILFRLNIAKSEYALATIHRAANTDDKEKLKSILDGLASLETKVILPLHPRTSKMMNEWNLSVNKNIDLIEPIGYFDMLILQENANCILTDSGGVQKEAYLLGVRCITLREETEWVETVEAGWNILVGANSQLIRDSFVNWFPKTERIKFYGNGDASVKIAEILKQI
ncbi:MAG: UDP-N-acetylglucosamine 2-epimerase (non-hydrolyzing) [Anaerolineales bacterium]|nr:UDP-N-acetylglucosamine 2-epimerase (non-hydrolyzing) [Anaerolineales bacterium]MBX3036802.1 UDP-N-acetylglucosamine 2-epimerase (non-hydrolyzing) [Anaerolineales bacterium]